MTKRQKDELILSLLDNLQKTKSSLTKMGNYLELLSEDMKEIEDAMKKISEVKPFIWQ